MGTLLPLPFVPSISELQRARACLTMQGLTSRTALCSPVLPTFSQPVIAWKESILLGLCHAVRLVGGFP